MEGLGVGLEAPPGSCGSVKHATPHAVCKVQAQRVETPRVVGGLLTLFRALARSCRSHLSRAWMAGPI